MDSNNTKIPAAWITIDSAIKGWLLRKGETNTALYNRSLSFTIDCVNELGYDVFKHFKEEILCVDQATLTAKLPSDFVSYVRLGFINNNGEFIPLTYNDLMIGLDVPVEDCHCSCGCGSPICESITSEVDTQVTILTPVKECNYNVDFSQVLSGISVDAFDYEYSFPDVVVLGNYPYTVAITINSILQAAVTINSQSDLDAFFVSYGFDNKINDTDYKTTPSQVTTNFGNLIFTGTPFVCSAATILTTTTLQTGSYEYEVFNPYPLTNVSIILGGVTYISTDTFTSEIQLVEWLNGLNFGVGLFDGLSCRVNSSIPDYLGNLSYTQTVVPTPVVIDAGITTHIPFQQCTYDMGSFPFTFNGFNIILGGVTYAITGTFTSVIQIVNVLNALNGGSGYFVHVTDRTFNARINSNTANYFGTFADTIEPFDYSTNNNSWVYNISSFVFPSALGASVIINGTAFTNSSSIATPTALVAWLNTLETNSQAVFTLTNPTTITVSYYGQNVNDTGITYPTTSAVFVFNGVPYTMSAGASNASAIVTYLNSLGIGAFGFKSGAGTPHTIFYVGAQKWDSMTAFFGSSSFATTPTVGIGAAGLNLITTLTGTGITTHQDVVIAATQTSSNTNTISWDCSGFTFPLQEIDLHINGNVLSQVQVFNSLTDVVTWLNTQEVGLFTLSGNFITITHVVSSIDLFNNPPPYTNISLIVDGNTYTLPEADTYNYLVDWLNTTFTGTWGLNIVPDFGGHVRVNVIDGTGQHIYTSLTLTDDDSDTVTFNFPRETTFGSILAITDLDGCINTEAVAPIINNPTLVYVPPFTLNTVTTSTGLRQIQQTISNETELDILMSELGWTKSATETYEIDSQPFIWEQFNLTVSGSPVIMFVNEFSCTIVTENSNYTDTVKIKINQDKSITKQTCLWGSAGITTQCNYNISFTGTLNFPFTAITYSKNGITTSVPDIVSQAALITFFNGLGFATLTNNSTSTSFRINQTTDTWTNFLYHDGQGSAVVKTFGKTACTSSLVEQKCHTETLCFVEEIKPCGCVTVSDATVNVLTQLNILNNQAYLRWLNGGSLYQTLAIAGNVWGYFNIDKFKGIVRFDKYWYQKAIYIQYYSANEVDSGDFLIPVQAKDAVMAYINYASKIMKDNVSATEKELAMKMWNNEKGKLKQYLNPFTEQDWLDLIRQLPVRP